MNGRHRSCGKKFLGSVQPTMGRRAILPVGPLSHRGYHPVRVNLSRPPVRRAGAFARFGDRALGRGESTPCAVC